MGKCVSEPVEVAHRRDQLGEVVPESFRWRGGRYEVTAVLGHWREDAGWWSGAGLAVPQRDLWRVEARGSRAAGTGAGEQGVYELVCEPTGWGLDRVWD
jgi:hypothetical protein